MRTTLISISTAFTLLSNYGFVSAGIVRAKQLEKRDYVCTRDDFYKGIWDNPEIYTAVTSSCSVALRYTDSTSCVAYITPVTYVWKTRPC